MDDDLRQVRLTATVVGRVQGVGFRWWTRRRALALGLVGWARNQGDGSVSVVAQGGRHACEQLLANLASGATPGRVDAVTATWSAAEPGLAGFEER